MGKCNPEIDINLSQPSGYYLYHQVKNLATLRSAHTVYLCVLYGSQNKQRLFPYTALTDWFVYPRLSVCCAVRTENIYFRVKFFFKIHNSVAKTGHPTGLCEQQDATLLDRKYRGTTFLWKVHNCSIVDTA